jgi:hypothetical protein
MPETFSHYEIHTIEKQEKHETPLSFRSLTRRIPDSPQLSAAPPVTRIITQES